MSISCNATYYGKTIRHIKVRMCEHLGISHLTGKPIHGIYHPSAVLDRRHECDYSPSFDEFSILTSEGNNFKINYAFEREFVN